jgi:putative transcriptional regulator
MNNNKFLTGQLLISQPKNIDKHFAMTVVLVVQHSETGAWGVVVNRKAKTVKMKHIMDAVGIDYDGDELAYIGGPVEPTRVQVIHTLDWSSANTLKITEDLGITGDVSVLAAISKGEGPKKYKAGVGLSVWSAGQLEGEQSGKAPWTPDHQWLTTSATINLVLSDSIEGLWEEAIDDIVRKRVASLF